MGVQWNGQEGHLPGRQGPSLRLTERGFLLLMVLLVAAFLAAAGVLNGWWL